MQKRHKDRKKYFNEQVYTSRKYVIPYLNTFLSTKEIRVLEIGCGEGGNLVPFLEADCQVVGVDLAQDKITNGKRYLSDYISNKQCHLYSKNIFEMDSLGEFDLIFFRDVIEHIEDHERLLAFCRGHLKADGFIFIAFPPWQNPFGGHQQMLNSFLSKLPFIHLLPSDFYRGLLVLTGERKAVIDELVDLRKSKVTLEYFQKLVARNLLNIVDLRLYLINPNYEIKFKLKPVILNKFFMKIRYVRNFYSTTCYSVLRKKEI